MSPPLAECKATQTAPVRWPWLADGQSHRMVRFEKEKNSKHIRAIKNRGFMGLTVTINYRGAHEAWKPAIMEYNR